MTYDEGLAVREKWHRGASFEWYGFKSARSEPSPRIVSDDPYMQSRYACGFADGKAMLQAEQAHVSR